MPDDVIATRAYIARALAVLDTLPRPTPISPEIVELYVASLASMGATEREIRGAMRLAAENEDWYPTLKVLRNYVRPRRLKVEAADIRRAILALAHYDGVTGEYWRVAEIERHLGRAARDAFEASGGSSAWRLRGEADVGWLNRRFDEAYAEYAAMDPPPEIPQLAALREIARSRRPALQGANTLHRLLSRGMP